MPQEATSEAHVPTQRSQAGQTSWFPAPHVDPRGASRSALTTPEGATAAFSLIERVRDRATFAALQRARRVRVGPVSIAFAPGRQGTRPQVAYAVGRNVGNAVTRNRLRRRLRGLVAERAACERLGAGAYMLGAGPAALDLTYEELRATVASALDDLEHPDQRGRRA